MMNTKKIFYESMQTGLGMAQQLPTNVTYDGELDDLYNGGNKKMKKLINGLSVDDACDIALSNLDIDGKEYDENVDKINALSDAWELYNKSWENFNDTYTIGDIEEMYNEIKDLFGKKGSKVIEGWIEDIDDVFYSNKDITSLDLNFGFKGNDMFESKKKITNKRLEEKKIDEEDRIEALAQFLGLDEEEKEDIESTYDDKNFEVNGEEYLVVTEDEGYEMAKEDVRSLLEDDLGLEGVSEDTQEYAIENFCTYDWESDLHSFNKSYCDDIKSEYDNEYGSRLVQECDDRVGLDDEDGGYVLTFEDDNGDTIYVYDKKSYGDDVDKAKRFLTQSNAFDFDTNDIEDKLTEEFGEDFEFDCSVEFEEDLVDFDDLSEKLTEELDKDYNSMAEWFDSIYGSGWVKEMRDTLKDYIDWEALAEYVVDVDGVANTLSTYNGEENSEKVNGEWFYIYRTN